jgi:hypothetical protein
VGRNQKGRQACGIASPEASMTDQDLSTPSANVVATTASTHSPPAADTSAPTSAALRDCAVTMPPLVVHVDALAVVHIAQERTADLD